MNPTRREALATGLALSGGLRLPFAAAGEQPKLTLATFTVEITPPVGHPCA